jgi:hypothetical protein
MSIIIENGMLITYMETELNCPICGQLFDASKKMDKAKYPVFNTKCPICKGKITIAEPFMGGNLECWETNCPASVERLITVMPNKVNGVPIPEPKLYDDNSDEPSDILV